MVGLQTGRVPGRKGFAGVPLQLKEYQQTVQLIAWHFFSTRWVRSFLAFQLTELALGLEPCWQQIARARIPLSKTRGAW